MSAAAKSYRYVAVGKGGTITIRHDEKVTAEIRHHTIPFVGTTGARTCVAVYFPIDDKRCFVAHINCYCERRDSSPFIPTVAEADKIRNEVFHRLDSESHRNSWAPKTSYMRDNLIMSSPHALEVHRDVAGFVPRRQTGWYIAQAVQQWLDIPLEARRPVEMQSNGFVVKHPSGSTWMLPHDVHSDLPSVEEQQWRPKEETGLENWVIRITSR